MATPPRDMIPAKKRKGRKELPDAPVNMPLGPLEYMNNGWCGEDHHGDVVFGFTVHGKPLPMPRPRFTARGATYCPMKIEDQAVYTFCKRLMENWQTDEELDNKEKEEKDKSPPFFPFRKDKWLSVQVTYRLARPASHFRGKFRQKRYYSRKSFEERPTGGDIDNLLKTTLDCLVKSGVIEDDCAVCHVNAWKIWADPREDDYEEANTTVVVTELKEPHKQNSPEKTIVKQRWIF